jgi:hypothetical protein
MRFSQKRPKMRAKIHKFFLRTNGLRTGALLGVISDIRKDHTNLEDPADVINEPQQGTHSQAVPFV